VIHFKPNQFQQFRNKFCVSREDCDNENLIDTDESNIFIPFDGTCRHKCPFRSELLSLNEMNSSYTCVDYKNHKPCGSIKITNYGDIGLLKRLKSCRVVKGFVEIQLTKPLELMCDQDEAFTNELSKTLANIEEIHEYLKITETPFIEDLAIFSNLKRIRGTRLFNNTYSLVLTKNAQLESIWIQNQDVTVDRGETIYELNRRLRTLSQSNVIKIEITPKPYAAQFTWELPVFVNQSELNNYIYYLYTEHEYINGFYCPGRHYEKYHKSSLSQELFSLF
jgi:Receptor L domain